MKNFTKQNIKQFTSRLSARWLIMALMMLVGTSSAWGAKTTLKQGETITFIFSQGDVPQNYGWNSTQLHIWDDSGNDETFDFNGQHVLVAGDWIPTNFQFISKYEHSGWRGQTSDIGDCGGKAKLQPNTTYSVKLAGKDETDWIKNQWDTGYPNKQFKITLHCFADCTPTVTNQIIIKCKSSETHVYAWVWDSDQKKYNGSTWPGNEITTTEDGYLVLKITTEKDLNVIFSDGQGNQTADITGLKVGKEYTYNYNDKTYELTGLGCITPSCFTINDLDIFASKTSICDGESVTFTLNNKQSGVTYKIGNTTIFNSNDAKPTYNTGAITGVSSKSYKIDATATGQCEAKTKTIAITVNSIPATPTFDPAPSYCAGDKNITLPTTDKAGNNLTWYKEDGSTAAGTPLNTVGTHTYKAKATNINGCVSSDYGTYSYKVKSLATASNYELTNTTADYTGRAVTLQISDVIVKNDAAAVSSIYFKQDAINVGTYKVYVTTEANNTYCAATDLEIGEFTINCKAPTKVDFVYSGATVTYDGNAQAQTVTWANNNDKGGAITVWYKSGSEYTQTAPTNAGVYTVAVTSDAAGNYCEAKQKIEKGTLIINCAQITDVANNFELSKTSYNYGELAKPTVSLKQNSTLVQAGLGAITTKYYNSSDQEVANPTAVGTYTAKIAIAEGTGYCALDETAVGNFTITCPVPAKVPTLSKTDVQKCNGVTGTKGTITITNYSTDYNGGNGYKFLLGDSFEPTIGNDGVMGEIDFVGDAETYKVQVATVCGSSISQYVNSTIQVNAINTVPTISLDPTSAPVCEGATFANITDYVTVNTNDKVNWYEQASGGTALEEREAIKVTTYYAEASIGDCKSERAQFEVSSIMKAPTVPEISASKNTICEGESVDITLVSREDGVTYTMNSSTVFIEDETYNTGALYDHTSFKLTATNSCGSTNSAELAIAVDKSPTFTAPAATQTNKEVRLTSAAGASTQWSVSPTENVTLTDNDDGTATFVATANGDYTITASNGVCAQVSHTIKVSDAFYIWVRNAKEGETAYGNFYHPDQNTEEYRGGAMYYAESTVLPTSGTVANFNQGGKEADIITTDCDGYTWYGFKASADVISGSKYFYVHAKNNINKAGWYTHTVPTKVNLTGDVYYTLCETNVNDCNEGSKGWKIVSASAPYAGPMVHASGSTTLGTNKFAALYVTDCSGKEIDAYQWEYCRTQDGDYQLYSSVCSYTFEKKDVVKTETSDAGKTNNIRPSELGYYRCKVTYKDGTTATSATEHILGSYSRSFTSNIPILVVNTGGKGFPDCTGISGQTASLNASKFKAKRSVDVKIYEGETLVYDRKARMNYRGSSSLNFVKKSYAFCPGDANCEEKDGQADYVKTAKLNMLGVGTACDKDWVLYAAAADPSLMRNRLVFDSYKAMTGKWGVNSRYVELIVDGVYKGVYVFMDKITMNNDRVKVDEDKGFIVKFDKTDREDRVGGLNGVIGDEKTFKTSYTGKDDIGTYDTSIDQRFEIEYPEKDDYTTGWKARVDGIQGMFQAFEDALKQGDYATVQKYIDYTSWADWFIINEFTKNVDAYRASCIFVYTGEAGAKIEARPLWDQELSFNNQASKGTSDKGSNSTTGLLIQHSNVYSDAFKAPFWFTGGGSDITGGLLSDPCFVQVVKERWNIHQFGALSKKSLEDLVDKYEDDLAPEGTTDNAQTRETAFWYGKSRGTCDCSYDTGNATATGYQNKTFAESTGTITSWIADGAGGRREGLTTAINGLTGASFSIQFIPSEAYTTPWEPVEIAVSITPAGYDYKLEYTDNDLGSVANTIIEEEGDKITYRIPRPDAWGTGDAEEGERDDIEYGIKATLSVQDGTTVCGSQAAPSSTGKIILQDEDNDNCK